MRRGSVDLVVVGLLGLAALLLLTRPTSSGYLWQDEAETAVLARNTLRFGYPRASDGRNTLAIPEEYGRGPGDAWIYSPWLPFYLLAGVFALVGESTGMARLPFALFGWLTVVLTWRLARALTDDRRIHRLSVALLTGSVPFLLHARQCRYYALTAALLVGLCLAYVAWVRLPTARRAALLAASCTLLFHSNFGTFVPAFGAALAHQCLWGTRATRRQGLAVAVVVIALTAPWAAFFFRSAVVGALSVARMAKHFEFYVRITNKYLVPIALIFGVTALRWVVGRRPPDVRGWWARWTSAQRFLLLMAIAQAVFLLIPDQRQMRYFIPTLPLLLIGEAWWLAAWCTRQRLLGGVVTAVLLLTNALQSPRPRVPLLDIMEELTHTYRGPMEGVVDYLRAHARPQDTVKIPYDDRTLIFYTDVRVERTADFAKPTDPDWVVIRRDWIPGEFFTSPYFRHIEATYERIELSAPDILWQNREDPGSHHFRTVAKAPRVVLYHRRAS